MVRAGPHGLKDACGAAARSGCARSLTRGPLLPLRSEGPGRPTARPVSTHAPSKCWVVPAYRLRRVSDNGLELMGCG